MLYNWFNDRKKRAITAAKVAVDRVFRGGGQYSRQTCDLLLKSDFLTKKPVIFEKSPHTYRQYRPVCASSTSTVHAYLHVCAACVRLGEKKVN